MSKEKVKTAMLDKEKSGLEKQKAGIKKYAAVGKMSDADSAAIAKLDKRLAEIKATRAPAGPLEIGGKDMAKATRPGSQVFDLKTEAGQLAAQKAKAADVSKKEKVVPIDNSQWTVLINTRSEKEIEQAILKTVIKHQQKLAN